MTDEEPLSRDITRTTLAVLFISALIAATFWVLHPFLTAIIWAATIVITTWPLMISIQKRLWGKRGLAVSLMTTVLLLVFIAPLTVTVHNIINRTDEIADKVQSLITFIKTPPPAWIEHLPVVGARITARWHEIAAIPPEELSRRLAPQTRQVVGWLFAQAGSIGMMTVQFLLTVIISAVLFTTGEAAACGVRRFAVRLAGQHGDDAVILAARAVRGVALGIVVTALIQTLLGCIGLILAGVPAVMLLTAAMFVLCVAQIGPGVILIPTVVWLYWQNENLWGSIMVAWTLFVGTIDNLIRPFLIKKGADLPLLLVFAGVIGGIMAFGVIGLFIGPVLLAVTYTLLEVWVTRGEHQDIQE